MADLPPAAAAWLQGNSAMAQRVRTHDWGATSLGAIESWTADLRTMAALVLETSLPAALMWGPDLTALYNNALLPLVVGEPEALGQPLETIRGKLWDQIGPVVRCAYTGEAPRSADHSFSISPVRSADGSTVGVFVIVPTAISAEAALRESEERLATVFENLPVGVGLTDASGTLVLSNEQMHRFLPTGVIPSRDAARHSRWRAWHPDGRRMEFHDFPGARALRGERVVPGVEMLYSDDAGREIWTHVAAVPLTGSRGQITGQLLVVSDIDALKRAAEALQTRETTLREVADNVPALIGYHDRDLRYVWVNQGFARFFGMGREEIIRRTVPQIVGERAFARLGPWMERALAGEAVHFEDFEPDRFGTGQAGWTDEHYVPRRSPGGVVEGFYVLALDITDRKRAEAALRESEERLMAVFESASVGLSEVSREGRFLQVNEELCRLLGRTREELLQLGVPDVTHPEDLPPSLEAVARSLEAGEAATLDKRYHRPDGSLVWAQSSITRLRSGQGRPDRLLVVTADLTARREAEAALRESEAGLREREGQLRVVLTELQHRTRNLLGVVQAIASRTLGDCEALDEYEDRLAAIGRVQGFLARSGAWSASLHDIIKAELQAAGDEDGHSTLDGPVVGLPGDKVQPMALALHELATNALKYGALSRPEGRLSITWRLQGEGEGRRLLLDWVETGVPMPDGGTPSHKGYGRQLIEQALPYQLKAEAQLTFGTEGVCCRIALPLAERREVP